MRMVRRGAVLFLWLAVTAALIDLPAVTSGAQGPAPGDGASNARLEALKRDVIAEVEARRQLTQQIVDSLFSFSELGFQEIETGRYLTGILEREGFTIRRGLAGIPTFWTATWGSGRPVIALGTDVDGVPATNQKPGVLARAELVPGAPGHGEGHNAGQALVVTAVLAAKRVMEREKLPGTIMVWPGIAEEQLATKAHLVRAGVFKDVDAVPLRARRVSARRAVGRSRRERPRLGPVHVRRDDLARRSRSLARQERPRRGRADEYRLELPARASPAGTAIALRHHERRRSAERRTLTGVRLVLLPRERLRPHHGDVGPG